MGCRFAGCGRPASAKELCTGHYQQAARGAELRVLQIKARHQHTVAEMRAIVDQIKIEKGCVDCGYQSHPVALDFDHLPGFEKRANVSALVKRGYQLNRVMDEIAKCEVVCSNCHRIRTAERRTCVSPLREMGLI